MILVAIADLTTQSVGWNIQSSPQVTWQPRTVPASRCAQGFSKTFHWYHYQGLLTCLKISERVGLQCLHVLEIIGVKQHLHRGLVAGWIASNPSMFAALFDIVDLVAVRSHHLSTRQCTGKCLCHSCSDPLHCICPHTPPPLPLAASKALVSVRGTDSTILPESMHTCAC